ncbi:hypothetical protein [Streptomyces sp. NPDC003247]|uniref:hypothetical protein n=1 Tax=Streptomyces sp. NPDC003247 TaxID=3364677 RepID=UPI0036A19723
MPEAVCPTLDTTADHVQNFAEMTNARTGHQLPDWLGKAHATDVPELVSFVNGIRMLKRQMFGRAGLDLLRKRVLLAG